MNRPIRLHHAAAVVKNLQQTHDFYTNIVGLPHVATWCEQFEDGKSYCHAFFELEDRGALAFFQFADSELYESNKRPENLSPFQHVAFSASKSCQQEIAKRADDHGLDVMFIDHGYCRSLYLSDPDNHTVEITTDHESAEDNYEARKLTAKAELDRWLAGDHTINNHTR